MSTDKVEEGKRLCERCGDLLPSEMVAWFENRYLCGNCIARVKRERESLPGCGPTGPTGPTGVFWKILDIKHGVRKDETGKILTIHPGTPALPQSSGK